jgi:hypothetical protein
MSSGPVCSDHSSDRGRPWISGLRPRVMFE